MVRMWIDANVSSPPWIPPWIDLFSETSEPRSEWAQGEAGKSLLTAWFQDSCCSPRDSQMERGKENGCELELLRNDA